jgi:hypothetical protein
MNHMVAISLHEIKFLSSLDVSHIELSERTTIHFANQIPCC